MSRVTMAEVADAAGVSTPTVSKVFSGRSDVSATTRRAVLDAAERLGYAAVAARPARQGNIALVIDAIDTGWALEVIRGAEEACAESGIALEVHSTRHGSISPDDWLPRVIESGIRGLIVALARADDGVAQALRALKASLVIIDAVGDRPKGITTIGATNWLGGRTATEHLLELGHTRIGLIAGPSEMESGRSRHDGYLAALRRADLAPASELMIHEEFTVSGGRRGSARLLELPEPPTAIFASNDLQAAGVYQEASARGLRIPADLSVVGFDDLPLCELLSPPLTSVRQPIAPMAKEAVRLLIGGPTGAPEDRVEMSTSLEHRLSTAPPARA